MNIPKNFWNAIVAATVLLAVFLVVVSIKELKAINYVGANPNLSNSISVTGTGEAMAVPDIATFSFSVTETANTVADAQAKATAKTNNALKAVKDGGVADKDIQTLSYNINPHYEYQSGVCTASVCRPGKSVLTGYDVSQTIQVKVRDLGKAGALFTAIGSLEVQSVNGLTFSVDNPDAVKSQARAQAIEKADAKAKQIAKQLGVTLVRVTSYSDSSDTPVPYYGMGGDMMSAKVESAPVANPSVPTGEQKITSNVYITYEIR